jgi:signal peptidase I
LKEGSVFEMVFPKDPRNASISQQIKSSSSKVAVATAPRTMSDETRGERIWANIKTIGGAVILALLIRTVLFEAFEIEGPSMEPTLLNGDRVVVSKFLYGLFLPLSDQSAVNWSVPELGDVVIIKSPADNVDIVKRVIGLPRDRIGIIDGVVYRNGAALAVQDIGPCLKGRGSHNPGCRVWKNFIGDKVFTTSGVPMWQTRATLTVPDKHVYVLGDHRDSSNDSRTIGTIPLRRLKGKALAMYWSSGLEGLRWDRVFRKVQ